MKKTKSITVIVTGGREYHDYAHVAAVLDAFCGLAPIALLVNGGASGVDSLARNWAAEAGIEWDTMHADWDTYGVSAGPRRNTAMLDAYPGAIVVAFPGGIGTRDMVGQARDRGAFVFEAKKGGPLCPAKLPRKRRSGAKPAPSKE